MTANLNLPVFFIFIRFLPLLPILPHVVLEFPGEIYRHIGPFVRLDIRSGYQLACRFQAAHLNNVLVSFYREIIVLFVHVYFRDIPESSGFLPLEVNDVTLLQLIEILFLPEGVSLPVYRNAEVSLAVSALVVPYFLYSSLHSHTSSFSCEEPRILSRPRKCLQFAAISSVGILLYFAHHSSSFSSRIAHIQSKHFISVT